MVKYISLKDTNVAIRKALKEAFPDTKFSVVGDSYAGGASTTVRYVDGPAEGLVKEALARFEGASFDGMIDLKSSRYDTVDGEVVHWGADYVFARREFSPAVAEAAEEFTRAAIAEDGGTPSPGWWGEFPQAFYRSRGEDESFRWGDQNFWSLRNIAASWLVEGRTLIVKVAA